MLWLFEAFLEYVRIKGMFVDRGDPAAADYVLGDFTRDNTWYELDLSGIVPANAKAVSVTLLMASPILGKQAFFRKHGNANARNVSVAYTQVNNVRVGHDLVIPVDTDRKIDYLFQAGFNFINFTVKGWWY